MLLTKVFVSDDWRHKRWIGSPTKYTTSSLYFALRIVALLSIKVICILSQLSL
jgi:hypothetical protein